MGSESSKQREKKSLCGMQQHAKNERKNKEVCPEESYYKLSRGPIVEGKRKLSRTLDDDFLFHPQLSQIILGCLTFQEQLLSFRGLNSYSSYQFDGYLCEEGSEYIGKEFGFEGSTFQPKRRKWKDARDVHALRPRFGSRDESRLRLRLLPYVDGAILDEFGDRILHLVKRKGGGGNEDEEVAMAEEEEDGAAGEKNEQQRTVSGQRISWMHELETTLIKAREKVNNKDARYMKLRLFVAKQFDHPTLILRQYTGTDDIARCDAFLVANPGWLTKQFRRPWACQVSSIEFHLSLKVPSLAVVNATTLESKYESDKSHYYGTGRTEAEKHEEKKYRDSFKEENMVLGHVLVTSSRGGFKQDREGNIDTTANLSQGLAVPNQFFGKITTLESVDLSGVKSLESIPDSFLSGCSSLKKLIFPPVRDPSPMAVSKIGNRFLSHCLSLERVDLSCFDRLTVIGKNCFAESGVRTVKLCDKEDYVRENTFKKFQDLRVPFVVENEWFKARFPEEEKK